MGGHHHHHGRGLAEDMPLPLKQVERRRAPRWLAGAGTGTAALIGIAR